MAVPEQTPFIEYTANGTTTVFPLPFQCDKAEYLIVNLDGNEAPVGSWGFVNGSVTFNTAPANGVVVNIERNTPFQRTTDYQSYNNSFRPAPVNKDFDLIWWKLQELGYRDQVIWLALVKEIADRIAGDEALQNQINTIDEWLGNLQENVDQNTNDIEQLVNDLSKEIADRIANDEALKEMFLAMMDEAINEGTINALAITHVESIEDLENITNVWDARTIYVKNLGNYRYDASTSSWLAVYQDANNVRDGDELQSAINKNTVRFVESLNDLIALPVWEDRVVYVEGSGYYKYTGGLWKNISVGFGGTVYLDDIVPDVTGVIDCAPAINEALLKYSGKGVTFLGNPNSKYLIQDTIDLNGKLNLELDFNYATLIDDVRGTIPQAGNRGKHAVVIYNSRDITVKKINYNITANRTNSNSTSIPTHVFWVGGQYLNPSTEPTVPTINVVIEDFKADGHGIDRGCVISVVGEADGVKLRRFDIKNGPWAFGTNTEYGLRPVDLEQDQTLTNGRHPYNVYIECFNGQNLPKCIGFLRTASCYNLKYFGCIGFNVPNFIYYYSGDRGISRFAQTVEFELCHSKLDDTMTVVQNAVAIVVTSRDGSTGEPLELWVNRDHQVSFKLCQFTGNYTQFSSALRFYGSLGKVVFDQCTFHRYYYGNWAAYTATTNPNTPSPFTLTFRDCVFKKNFVDVHQIDVPGVLYDNCKFKQRAISALPYQIEILNSINTCAGTTFRHCYISEQPSNTIPMRIESDGVYLHNNTFELFQGSTGVSVSTTALTYGANNSTNGKLTSDAETENRIIGERKKIKVFTDVGNNDTLGFEKSDIWLINDTQTIGAINNGELGDEIIIRAGVAGANCTFVHNSPTATTTTRLLNKSGANDNVTGLTLSRRYIKFVDGWREM
ncbi:hypothetical protein [Acinetobacter baumannii]|uniref:hypothetical protein n=1 Tax=Acinetobacter baumannii TaxID=470 RepID=UPI0010C7EE70|nr:hypothetical protein [Acinetobacter baumannii]QCP22439.1 hypothetical protein FDF35_01375 [Acinetobacter baumannii]